MSIEFDTIKRQKTLLERGPDFADSDKIFAGIHFVARDDRFIISMRYANDREISRYKKYRG